MTTKYHNTTTDMLVEKLKTLSAKVADNVKAMAEILVELHRRGERHPFMREGLLRWYVPIANGTLTPLAAVTFAGVGTIIRKLIGLDPALQDQFANGASVLIADHDASGKIVGVEKPLLQLTTRQLDMAFADGRVVPFAKQKRILAERGNAKDVRRSKVAVKIRADVDTGEIVCGQLRFKPTDLQPALTELGYKPLERVKAR